MKKIMFALCFMFGGIVTLTAQDTQDTTSNQYRTETQSQYPQDGMTQQQDRERIQATELPDEVKRSLEGEEYRGWLISGAFKSQGGDQSMGRDTVSTGVQGNEPNVNATGAEGEEVFIVELKNGAETKEVYFDNSGQKLEGMEEGNSPSNQYNQNDQLNQNNDQLNQNEQMEPTNPSEQSLPTDPNAADQPDQAGQSPAQTDPSSGTPSDQSTQSPQSGTPTDQSRANDPK